MKWFDVFKLYNLKKIRKEKIILIFTAISIFVTTLISLLAPQITQNTKMVMDSSIRKLNGGDLMIQVQYPSKAFNNELANLKDEGYEITFEGLTNGYYRNNNGKNTVGKLIFGDFNLSKNEIILYKSIANSTKAKIGDEIEIESSKTGIKKYVVKEIESIPYGVDSNTKSLGYGKISLDNYKELLKDGQYLVFINGGDSERLKSRLNNIEDGYVYTSLKDKEKATQSDVDNEITSYSVISTMAYVLSIITIITTTVMMLLRRKNDFAILKMLWISGKSLKRAMLLEISLIIIIPIILAAISSFKLSTVILSFNGTIELISTGEKLSIIFKGVIFNCVLFFLFLNIALMLLKSIKPLSIIREDQLETKKVRKKMIIISVILVPILLFAYSLYLGRLSAFVGGGVILLFIGAFLLITIYILKLISLIPFKNNVFIYAFKSIRKNYMSFTMILLSITITILFLLIGFTLNKTIEDSMNDTMKDTLPYNYILYEKSDVNLGKAIENNKYINKYSKFYGIGGKVSNNNIKSKAITINKVKEKEYNTRYKILEGQNLFEGNEDEILISNKYKKLNKLNVGDYINVETLSGKFEYRIKGVYDGGEFNSQTVLKKYDGMGKRTINYIIDSNDEKWMDDIGEAYIISIDSLSSSFSVMLNKITDVFKYLCFLCIFSSLLFNMNTIYMNYLENKKDETIIIALGIGKDFCVKYQLFKLILLVITSTIMSFGIYALVLKIALKLFLNSSTYISPMYLLASMGISILLSIIGFSLPLKDLNKKTSYELLKE